MKRSIACVVIVALTLATMNVYAEAPRRNAGELRHEAFLRGGDAISAALNAKTIEPLISEALTPPAPERSMPAARQDGGNRRLMLWIGIAVTGTIAGFLIQKAVRDHGKIFTPQN